MKQMAMLCAVCMMLVGITACGGNETAPDNTAVTTTTAVEVTTTTTATETTTVATTTTTAASVPNEPIVTVNFDLDNHWNEGEDPEAHTVSGEGVCEECGVQISIGDGTAVASLADEYGNYLRMLTYEGHTLVEDNQYAYYDGIDATYCVRSTTYYASGAVYSIGESDADGNTSATVYAEDGSVMSREEMITDADGNVITTTYDADDKVTQKIVIEYGDNLDFVTSVYDGDGRLISTEETVYDEDFNFTSTYVFYNTDGTVKSKEIWVSGEDGITKTIYDADGNVTGTETF